jgi:acyl-CoA hydrolase
MEAKKISDSETVMTQMVMPNDANPMGNLMGGNLLRWMDIVSGICAGKHTNADVVTASVDYVSFSRPIDIGDVITMNATVTRAFNTSVEVFVEVFAADIKGGNNRKCNDAYFTFVGVEKKEDGDIKPIRIPPVLPLTGDEQLKFDAALRRRELRLILAGRMKPADADNLRALFDK